MHTTNWMSVFNHFAFLLGLSLSIAVSTYPYDFPSIPLALFCRAVPLVLVKILIQIVCRSHWLQSIVLKHPTFLVHLWLFFLLPFFALCSEALRYRIQMNDIYIFSIRETVNLSLIMKFMNSLVRIYACEIKSNYITSFISLFSFSILLSLTIVLSASVHFLSPSFLLSTLYPYYQPLTIKSMHIIRLIRIIFLDCLRFLLLLFVFVPCQFVRSFLFFFDCAECELSQDQNNFVAIIIVPPDIASAKI